MIFNQTIIELAALYSVIAGFVFLTESGTFEIV